MVADITAIKLVLTRAIFETFEKMFFIFFEPIENQTPDFEYESVITFSGSGQGEMRICFSPQVLSVMVQNLLGVRPADVTESAIEDCAREALNIACGNFLTKLDREKAPQLSIPIITRKTQPGNLSQVSSAGQNACMIDCDSESGRIRVLVNFSG